jgi:hypothetical protein
MRGLFLLFPPYFLNINTFEASTERETKNDLKKAKYL